MKITYAVEFDLKRTDGRNLSKADVSTLLLKRLTDLQDTIADDIYEITANAVDTGIGTEYDATVTVWPFEGSEPSEVAGLTTTKRRPS